MKAEMKEFPLQEDCKQLKQKSFWSFSEQAPKLEAKRTEADDKRLTLRNLLECLHDAFFITFCKKLLRKLQSARILNNSRIKALSFTRKGIHLRWKRIKIFKFVQIKKETQNEENILIHQSSIFLCLDTVYKPNKSI